MPCVRPCAEGPLGCVTLLAWCLWGGLTGGILWSVAAIISSLFCCVPRIGKIARAVACVYFDPISNDIHYTPASFVSTRINYCCRVYNFLDLIWLLTFGWILFIHSLIWAAVAAPYAFFGIILGLEDKCAIVSVFRFHWAFAKIAFWPMGVKTDDQEEESNVRSLGPVVLISMVK